MTALRIAPRAGRGSPSRARSVLPRELRELRERRPPSPALPDGRRKRTFTGSFAAASYQSDDLRVRRLRRLRRQVEHAAALPLDGLRAGPRPPRRSPPRTAGARRRPSTRRPSAAGSRVMGSGFDAPGTISHIRSPTVRILRPLFLPPRKTISAAVPPLRVDVEVRAPAASGRPRTWRRPRRDHGLLERVARRVDRLEPRVDLRRRLARAATPPSQRDERERRTTARGIS